MIELDTNRDAAKNHEAEIAKADRDGVLSVEDELKLNGLKSVLEGFHRGESVLVDQVGDGTRLANLYETSPEKVLALRDMILGEQRQG